jgi:diguanylate cyclase (GGDEF)-like protein
MLHLACTDPIAQQLLMAYADSPLLVALLDADDQLRFANPAFRSAYGLDDGELLSWSALMCRNHAQRKGAYIETHDIETWLSTIRSRRGKLPFRAFEADLCDGRWIWMTETLRADGWMLCVASDITVLKSGERSMRQQRDVALRAAQTDGMTGISNRAHIMDLLRDSIDERQHRAAPCGVVLLDLDHFKRVNDSYGHPAGDAVLKDFAHTVQRSLRRDDGFGRLGGEEFLLLFRGMSPKNLGSVVSVLLNVVRQRHPLPAHPEFGYTCSAGMTELRLGDDVRSVYKRVDEALYQAKGAGRDRSMWAI